MRFILNVVESIISLIPEAESYKELGIGHVRIQV